MLKPMDAMYAKLNHALNWFSSSLRTTVESHPPSAVVERIAAAEPVTRAISRMTRWCRLSTAVAASRDASAAKSVAYQRRLKRTSSIGPNTTAQKFGDSAAAVMPAIFASETCWPDSIWGIAKNASPPYSPNDEFDSPMIQIGGAVRSDFKQVSGVLWSGFHTTRLLTEQLRFALWADYQPICRIRSRIKPL